MISPSIFSVRHLRRTHLTKTPLLLLAILAFYLFVLALFALHVAISGIHPFAGADAQTFADGGRHLYERLGPIWSIDGIQAFWEPLTSFRYRSKYWGFVLVNYFGVSLFPSNALLQSLTVKLVTTAIWLLFLMHAYFNVLRFYRRGKHVLVLFIIMGLFPVLINYRDIYVAVILYFIAYAVFVRGRWLSPVLLIALLLFFRDEFIPVVLLGLGLIWSSNKFWSDHKLLWFAFSSALPILVIGLFFPHKLFLENLIYLPLSFFGVNFVASWFLYLTGDHTLQDRLLNFVFYELYTALRPIFLYCMIYALVLKARDIRFERPFLFAIFMFGFFWVTYTMYHEGFQPRVNASVLTLMVFAPWDKIKLSRTVLLAYIVVFLAIMSRNLRWLF